MNAVVSNPARIFVIDDEPGNLKLLDKLLSSQGYTQRVLIQDPCQVLDHYHAARPDLILLDINMPQMDGYQVMESLKALGDPLMAPIVVMTAQQGRDSMLKALSAGARDFVGKPFDRLELLMRVRNLLDAQLAHRIVHDHNEVLEAMVRVRTDMLKRTRLQIVQRLGLAAEYRDNETGLHVLRMSRSAECLARSMAWNSADCELLLHASPMHDVGKIGIPDSILLKPGRLEPGEWETMKTHCAIGARILDDSDGDCDLLRLAQEIALSHHEKWDGSGYPHGLVGEAIPMAARIVAVADVFDALTSRRTYKKAWTVDDAVAFVNAQSGLHFDPHVVRHFNACLAEILAIRNALLESESV